MTGDDLRRVVRVFLHADVSERVLARLQERAEGDPRVVLDVLRHALDHADGPLLGLEHALGNGIAPPSWILRRETDYWTIRYGERVVRLPDLAGLHYLAALLAKPGTSIEATVLVHCGIRRSGNVDREQARLAVTKSIETAMKRLAHLHPALARHLRSTIQRGYRCVYRPDPSLLARWDVASGDLPPSEPVDEPAG